MKLLTTDNTELMEVSRLRREGRSLIVEGKIMGAMPTRAVLTPAELRKGLKLLDFGTFFFIVRMFFSR